MYPRTAYTATATTQLPNNNVHTHTRDGKVRSPSSTHLFPLSSKHPKHPARPESLSIKRIFSASQISGAATCAAGLCGGTHTTHRYVHAPPKPNDSVYAPALFLSDSLSRLQNRVSATSARCHVERYTHI
ncbi:hypothetical protein SCLCIDRAFT_783902 [Scleroderma citrinum Foug A]|uniref:Uncharacterized protein n=1 Tax=Scleroderma citrinum Foug A TaxID=1036808 RepID=A0A0C3E383_9AGAM|nr:hypothetical protein SCLCIDRAFT_783902 [Scleroderma citrinum Foug A]